MKLEYIEYFKSKHKSEIKKLYIKSFPKSERFPFWILKQCSKQENVSFNAILDDDKLIGMQYIITYENMTYLMYFAIEENRRRNGYGSKVLEDLMKKYETIILSIERIKEDLRGNKERRKSFYIRNGFIETNKFIKDAGIEYEMLCTNKNYNITKEDLEKRYTKMTDSKIMKYIIGKMFNVYNINFIN